MLWNISETPHQNASDMPRTSHVLPWPGANLWVTQHGMCEVLFLHHLFSQQTRTKNVRSKQGLSNLNINTRYQYHVCNLYPCNIVQHCISSAIRKDSTRRFIKMLLSQICLNWRVYIRSTKMCCLARLQIHDGATIPKSGGTITTVWAHLHALWISGWSLNTRTL